MNSSKDEVLKIYDVVSGHRDADADTQWVQTLFVDGTPYMSAFDQLWDARISLARRLGGGLDDRDISGILSAVMKMEEEIGLAMFRCGMEYAMRKK